MSFILGVLLIFMALAGGLGAVAYFTYRQKLRRAKAIERGLKMVPILIHLPPPSSDTHGGARDVREVMREKTAQAQVLYDLIAGTATEGFKSTFYGQRHVALELIAAEGLVHFYAAVPVALVGTVEKAIQTAYPGARMEMVEDHNIFNQEGRLAATLGGEMVLRAESAFPIATYSKLERDPMEALLTTIAALDKHDGVGIQLMLRPAHAGWTKQSVKLANLKRRGRHSANLTPADLAKAALKAPEQRREEDRAKLGGQELSNLQLTEIESIEDKTKHPGFEVLVRVIVSTGSVARSQQLLREIATTFALYDAPGLNGFKFLPAIDVQGLVTAFIFRFFPPELSSNVLNSIELATLFHLPDSQFTPAASVERQKSKQVDGPVRLPTVGLLFGYNEFRGVKKEIRLSAEDRRRHTYILGQTGTGKSTMLENLAVQDMLAGNGFAFIDPHGDSAEKLLALVPKERAEDIIYFNPADTQYPLGLNLFEFTDPAQKDFLVQETINMLYKLYDPGHTGIIGPRYEHWYRNAALTLMSDPNGATFIEIPKVFTDTDYLKSKFKYLKDPTVIDFWTKEMGQTSDYHKSEMLGWFVSKFGAFQNNEMMRNIIGQTKSSFNLREVMDQKKILIVNLSKGQVGELNSQLLGMMFVIKFQAAAMSRANVPEDQRADFALYVDEFQNFSTDSFASILSEARKYRLNLIVANQFIGQLKPEIRDAVFGNIGTIVAHRMGPEDAEFMVKQFAPVFDASDLMNLPNYNAAMRLMIGGLPSQPFTILDSPPIGKPNLELGLAVKQLSAAKYGHDRAHVEADIMDRLSGGAAVGPALPSGDQPAGQAPGAPVAPVSPPVQASAPVLPPAPVATPVPVPVLPPAPEPAPVPQPVPVSASPVDPMAALAMQSDVGVAAVSPTQPQQIPQQQPMVPVTASLAGSGMAIAPPPIGAPPIDAPPIGAPPVDVPNQAEPVQSLVQPEPAPLSPGAGMVQPAPIIQDPNLNQLADQEYASRTFAPMGAPLPPAEPTPPVSQGAPAGMATAPPPIGAPPVQVPPIGAPPVDLAPVAEAPETRSVTPAPQAPPPAVPTSAPGMLTVSDITGGRPSPRVNELDPASVPILEEGAAMPAPAPAATPVLSPDPAAPEVPLGSGAPLPTDPYANIEVLGDLTQPAAPGQSSAQPTAEAPARPSGQPLPGDPYAGIDVMGDGPDQAASEPLVPAEATAPAPQPEEPASLPSVPEPLPEPIVPKPVAPEPVRPPIPTPAPIPAPAPAPRPEPKPQPEPHMQSQPQSQPVLESVPVRQAEEAIQPQPQPQRQLQPQRQPQPRQQRDQRLQSRPRAEGRPAPVPTPSPVLEPEPLVPEIASPEPIVREVSQPKPRPSFPPLPDEPLIHFVDPKAEEVLSRPDVPESFQAERDDVRSPEADMLAGLPEGVKLVDQPPQRPQSVPVSQPVPVPTPAPTPVPLPPVVPAPVAPPPAPAAVSAPTPVPTVATPAPTTAQPLVQMATTPPPIGAPPVGTSGGQPAPVQPPVQAPTQVSQPAPSQPAPPAAETPVPESNASLVEALEKGIPVESESAPVSAPPASPADKLESVAQMLDESKTQPPAPDVKPASAPPAAPVEAPSVAPAEAPAQVSPKVPPATPVTPSEQIQKAEHEIDDLLSQSLLHGDSHRRLPEPIMPVQADGTPVSGVTVMVDPNTGIPMVPATQRPRSEHHGLKVIQPLEPIVPPKERFAKELAELNAETGQAQAPAPVRQPAVQQAQAPVQAPPPRPAVQTAPPAAPVPQAQAPVPQRQPVPPRAVQAPASASQPVVPPVPAHQTKAISTPSFSSSPEIKELKEDTAAVLSEVPAIVKHIGKLLPQPASNDQADDTGMPKAESLAANDVARARAEKEAEAKLHPKPAQESSVPQTQVSKVQEAPAPAAALPPAAEAPKPAEAKIFRHKQRRRDKHDEKPIEVVESPEEAEHNRPTEAEAQAAGLTGKLILPTGEKPKVEPEPTKTQKPKKLAPGEVFVDEKGNVVIGE